MSRLNQRDPYEAFSVISTISPVLYCRLPRFGAHYDLVRKTLISLKLIERLEAILTAITPFNVSLEQYKKTVVRDVVIIMRGLEARIRVQDELETELLA